jgi:hypothetical protein
LLVVFELGSLTVMRRGLYDTRVRACRMMR